MLLTSRNLSAKFILLGIFFTLILVVLKTGFLPTNPQTLLSPRKRYSCPPRSYAAGKWVYRPRTDLNEMTDKDQALTFAGLEGCASSREYYWHLASDQEEQWGRFPMVSSWEWQPGSDCNAREFVKEEMVRDLVEQGGWLILGGTPSKSKIIYLGVKLMSLILSNSDSISEGQFFSLSCMLYPHVLATPNYTANPYWDRAWPQNLYLNPESPLTSTLSLPPGFSAESTPLVTFRRVDLLLDESELANVHQKIYNPPPGFKLFGEDQVWSFSLRDSMELFTSPLPGANYGTLVVSTGGHWTTTTLAGFRDESKSEKGYGIDKVIEFFGHAMKSWTAGVQAALSIDQESRDGGVVLKNGGRGRRRAVVRAYLPGHEDCHSHKNPWREVQPFQWNWFNWGNIWEFNQVFEVRGSILRFPDIR